jgi:diguanylate cyclase (GGDEF)-like protein
VLDALAREADLAVGGGMAGVYLLDADGYGVATAGHNCPEEWFGYRLAPGEGIAGQVLATGSTVLTSAYQEEMTLPREIVMPGVRCGVGVPMCWNGRLRGALSIGFLHERELTRDDLNTLEAIADLAVVACHNAEVHGDVRTAASTDALSGLLNHGAMQTRVREEIFRAVRQGHPLSCVLIDLDDFKRINDDLGHAAGDALLRRVADALRAEIRPYDSAARYGGDEFVLLLPGSDEAAGRQIAERVRLRIAGGGEGPLSTCSIGVAGWEDAMDADQLLAAADRALMLAKRTGKSRVAVANPVAEEQLAALQLSDGSPAAVEALVAAIEARDRYGGEHSASVHALATRVALLLGLPAQSVAGSGTPHCCTTSASWRCRTRSSGSRGRSTTPSGRSWRSTRWSASRSCSASPGWQRSRRSCATSTSTGTAAAIPDGLAGHRIPIGSRVILACDAYSAMTATRPYRPALAQTDAVAQLRARAGTQFDPQVVEALLDLLGYG